MILRTMPDYGGHQHGGEKISPFILLKDKKMRTLLGMILIGTVTTMFYGSFYGTYMEQMQVSNSLMTVILFIGGIFAKEFGVSNMFLFFGCFLFTAAVILFPVARKMSRTDDGKW